MVILKAARIASCASLLLATHIITAPLSFAQDADRNVQEFASLLQQIENVRLATAQREAMIATQEQQIESLEAQIASAPEVTSSIKDIALKMVAEVEKQVEADLPFRQEERNRELGDLLFLASDEASSPSHIFRDALRMIEIETEYGNSISAYTGNNPISSEAGWRLKACLEDVDSSACNLSKEMYERLDAGAKLSGGGIEDISDEVKDGNYVHFGRMSFAYLDLDSRNGYRWNKDTGEWDQLNGTEILNVRRAIRVAKGESAPSVVMGPIQIEAAE